MFVFTFKKCFENILKIFNCFLYFKLIFFMLYIFFGLAPLLRFYYNSNYKIIIFIIKIIIFRKLRPNYLGS